MEISKVLLKPVISESSIKDMESNKYVFVVSKHANKYEVAKAVKESFSVDVLNVRTRIIKGRSRRSLRRRDRVALGPSKRATVQIGKDQKIKIFETKK